MTTYVDFIPSVTSPFEFRLQLDGQTYTCIVTWNFFGQRYYINIYDLSNNLILARSMTGSPSLASAIKHDLNLAAGYFTTSSLVWRPSNNQFEISP